jgi:hypothetical protein
MSKSKFIKKPLISAAFLVSASTAKASDGGGVTEGGKSQLGVNHLTLEEIPSENIKICVPEEMSKIAGNGEFHFMPDSVSVVIPPFETNTVKMSFVVSQMVSHEEDHVLILVYSQQKSPSPQIPTPLSRQKFELDLNTLEVVGLYDIPALNLQAQNPTIIGFTNPVPRSKVEFDLNLNTSSISTLMNAGVNEIYLQAALLRQSDYASGIFENMILSEVDTLHFEENECPEDHIVFGAENEGGKSLVGESHGFGGSTEGSRPVLGVNALRLEAALGRNATICSPENVSSVGDIHFIPDNSALVVDPISYTTIELNFWVSDVLPDDKDRILVLAYSPKITDKPQIPTPFSLNKFWLELSTLEIIAVYNIPTQELLTQEKTRLGFASSQQISKQVIKIKLDTTNLANMVKEKEMIYVQAWLMSKSDFELGAFDTMILSEVDTIRLVAECPENGPQ